MKLGMGRRQKICNKIQKVDESMNSNGNGKKGTSTENRKVVLEERQMTSISRAAVYHKPLSRPSVGKYYS